MYQIIYSQAFWSDFPSDMEESKMQIFYDILFAKANGTITGYLYKCREFFAWIKKLNIPLVLPIKESIIAAFIVNKSKVSNSDSTIVTMAAAIKWLHSIVNITPNPVDAPIVQQLVISERRKLHKPPVQKEPLSLDLVKAIIDKFGHSGCSLIDLRTACYVSLNFTLLFRHAEMAQIKASHIQVLPAENGLSIFIPHSKTDIFRDGNTTFLADTQDKYSPVKILKRFMAKCNIEIGQDAYLFTALSYHSSTLSYTPLLTRPLSYTRCREMFLDALKQVGIEEPTNYGLHSMRSGGSNAFSKQRSIRRTNNAAWKVENHQGKKQIYQKRSGSTYERGKNSFWSII